MPATRTSKTQTTEDLPATRKTKTKKILVVAFGDSLTAGYQPPKAGTASPTLTPYTDYLKKMIDEALKKSGKPKLVDVIFYNKGVSGELTADMLRRLQSDVISVRPSYTVILGGSNDIGWGTEPRGILDDLVQMYEKSSSSGIEVIACTVPSIIGPETYVDPRLELNELISDYCFENEMICVDLFSATKDQHTNMLDKKYSSDGLHLNTLGYLKMAEVIFNQAFSNFIPIWIMV